MEQWHQKLHNNTSPDDVVICEALLAYIAAGLDIAAYWATLHVRAACLLTRHPRKADAACDISISLGVSFPLVFLHKNYICMCV